MLISLFSFSLGLPSNAAKISLPKKLELALLRSAHFGNCPLFAFFFFLPHTAHKNALDTSAARKKRSFCCVHRKKIGPDYLFTTDKTRVVRDTGQVFDDAAHQGSHRNQQQRKGSGQGFLPSSKSLRDGDVAIVGYDEKQNVGSGGTAI